MKTILIMGAGAVGGYFGARLADAGNRVYLVARGKHLDALMRFGLKLESPAGNLHLMLPASDKPASLGVTPDWIFFCVKSYDTRAAIPRIKSVTGPQTQILSLQNGVENYDLLAAAYGKDRVVRGFCRLGGEVREPGVVIHTAFGDITYGEDDGSQSQRIRNLEALLAQAGIEQTISTGIRRDSWIKFTWNSVYNVLTGLLGVPTGTLYQDPDRVEQMWRMFREIRSVAGALGVTLTDDDFRQMLDSTKKLGDFKTSTLYDREKGKPLEFEAFTGAILRMAAQTGQDVPEFTALHHRFLNTNVIK